VLDSGEPMSESAAPFCSTELPPAAVWQKSVAEAVAAMERGGLEKVVLTRQQQLHSHAPIPHRYMLSTLAGRYPGCTLLSVSFGEGVLLAATPEKLFEMSAESIHCDALAGTFPAYVDQPDVRMELYEHAPVVQAIEEALRPLCNDVRIEKSANPLSLQSLSHLYTSLHATPRTGLRPLQVAAALHPTPAVGGMPQAEALAWIRQHENQDRGWYTGAFGWLGDNQQAQLSVILRCALVHGKSARLYAGAGITPVSNPEQELQETCLKLEPMLDALSA